MRLSQPALIWVLLAVMAAASAASLYFAGLRVDFASNPSAFVGIALLFAVAGFYHAIRPNPELRDATLAGGQILLVLLSGILLTYAAAVAKFPYRDAELHAIDQAIGLDRRAYLAFFQRPWLHTILGVAYWTLLPQYAFAMLAMFLSRQMPRLRMMILATGIALLVTSTISVFTPAMNALIYVDITPAAFPEVAHQIHTYFPTLEALRAGAMHTVSLNHVDGLVSFPSFHTAGALIFIWTLWKMPQLRWPIFVLNVTMIAATPIFGDHYFVDILGGGIVAVVSILVVEWLNRHATQASRTTIEVSPSSV